MGTTKVSSTTLNDYKKKIKACVQDVRLRSVVGDPARRKERARALKRLESCSRRLACGAHDEIQRVRELYELCQLLESKTKKTAYQLLQELTRKARKR